MNHKVRITPEDIYNLRGKTNIGLMQAKQALQECYGSTELAIEWVKTKGLAIATKHPSSHPHEIVKAKAKLLYESTQAQLHHT